VVEKASGAAVFQPAVSRNGIGIAAPRRDRTGSGGYPGFIPARVQDAMVRHFLLNVGVPAEARKLLGRFVNGNESDAPQITTAEDWHVGCEPGPGRQCE